MYLFVFYPVNYGACLIKLVLYPVNSADMIFLRHNFIHKLNYFKLFLWSTIFIRLVTCNAYYYHKRAKISYDVLDADSAGNIFGTTRFSRLVHSLKICGVALRNTWIPLGSQSISLENEINSVKCRRMQASLSLS